MGRRWGKKKLTDNWRSGCVREKKLWTQNPVVGLRSVSIHPKHPKTGSFGWCFGGCWSLKPHFRFYNFFNSTTKVQNVTSVLVYFAWSAAPNGNSIISLCTVLIHKFKISTPIILRVFNGTFIGKLNLKPITFIHHWQVKAEITSCVPALKTSSPSIKGQLNKK